MKTNNILPLIVIFILIALINCDWIQRKISPTWMGTYYPHGRPYSEKTWVNKHGFESLEACQAWAKEMMVNPTDEYECGKNCYEDQPGLYLCESTTQWQ